MQTALIIFGIVLAIIVILLFLPIIIRVDTATDVYLARFSRILGIQLTEQNEEFMLIFQLPFYRKEFFPFRSSGKSKQKPEKKASKKSGISPRKFLAILKSFQVKTLYCSVDTGDFVRNAWLIPVIQLTAPKNIAINFLGEFQLKLFVTNNLWRIGRAYLSG